MAMNAKVDVRHRRANSTSSASSPRLINAIHGRRATDDSGGGESTSPPPAKTLPNYLKHTFSSAHEICPQANKPPATDSPPAVTVKRLPRRRSVDKLPEEKDKAPKIASPSWRPAVSPKLLPLKTTSKSSVKTTASPKMIKSKEKEEEHSPCDVHPVGSEPKTTRGSNSSRPLQHRARSLKQAPKVAKDDGSNDSDEHYEGSGESLAGSGGTGDEGGERRLKFRQRREEGGAEHVGVTLKKQAGRVKESPPASNEVIKETASKLVVKRRSKVAALVGAFETVISLQEPEPSQGQEQEEEEEEKEKDVVAKVVVKEEVASHGDEEGESKVGDEEAKDGEVVVGAEEEKVEAGEGGDAGVVEEVNKRTTNELIESMEKGDEGSSEPLDGAAA